MSNKKTKKEKENNLSLDVSVAAAALSTLVGPLVAHDPCQGHPSARRRTKGRRLPCQHLPKPTRPIQTRAVRGSYQGETDRERSVGAHATHQAHAYHTWWV